MYQYAEGKLLAQIVLRTNDFGGHNGLACYLVRGVSLQTQFLDRVRAADSVANFNIAFVKDESLAGAGHADLLIATTECRATGCTEIPVRMSNDFRIMWPNAIWHPENNIYQYVVPLSVTLQSLEYQDGWDQTQALAQFHELMTRFKLLPLRSFYSPN